MTDPPAAAGAVTQPVLSPDGHWWWDGAAWRPVPQPPSVPKGAYVSPDGKWWWDGQRWQATPAHEVMPAVAASTASPQAISVNAHPGGAVQLTSQVYGGVLASTGVLALDSGRLRLTDSKKGAVFDVPVAEVTAVHVRFFSTYITFKVGGKRYRFNFGSPNTFFAGGAMGCFAVIYLVLLPVYVIELHRAHVIGAAWRAALPRGT